MGNINIDSYQTNTPDKAEYQGHFYSDKAPGTVALALPAFAASALALRLAGSDLDSPSGWLISSWIACVGSIGIITALGAGLMFKWLCGRVGPKHALVTTLAIFLGAAPLPYATMMFSHSFVVGLIAIALCASGKPTEGEAELDGVNRGRLAEGSNVRIWLRAQRWEMLAGFVCGWALASEYTAGIVVTGVFMWLLTRPWPGCGGSASLARRVLRRAIPFCVGATPPLLLIPLYSWACFGNPFILPYSLNASFPEMREGLYAIRWPDAQTAYNLLFSPTRGLFFWTPFLAIAGAGYWKLARRNQGLFWLTYAVPVLQIIVISGRTWDWPAGPTLGPRYLAPILPLLALPCALGVQRFPRIGMVLAAYSILITTLATLTNACPPARYYNPLAELQIPLLLKGEFSPNLGLVLGLPPYASVVLFYGMLIVGIAWLWLKLPRDET